MSAKSDNEAEFTAVALVVVLPIILAIVVPFLLWSGWAVTILWGWFVAPTFGLPALTITQAAGICLLLGVMRARMAAPKDETTWGLKLFAMVFGPPIAVGVGWVIKWLAL